MTSRAVKKAPHVVGQAAASLPPPYAYPWHCGMQTMLSVYGWRCAACGAYLAFKDEYGRDWNAIRLGKHTTTQEAPHAE